MALVLSIIEFIAILGFLVALAWSWRSEESMPSIVTKTVFAAILFAIQIPQLVIDVSLDKSYANTILLLVLWALNVWLSAFGIGAKLNSTPSIVIEISHCTNRTDEDTEN